MFQISKNILKKILNGLVFVKGKFLKVNNNDFSTILQHLKDYLINKLDENILYKNIDNIKYLKWCYDKLFLQNSNIDVSKIYKSGCICWVNFGINIGSELQKLRPAILWRSSADKKIWTVIPLSTKCFNDTYYFHYDLKNLPNSTAKIESLTNFSYKRIKEPYFYNKKIAHIDKEDYENLLKVIKKYYTFE